ncbi:glycosyltransferase family 2 protein [Tropicimonas sediminicola]|uniref:Galactosyltransferase n=1 Tax=Tropicimonas sediminicola TaxID=1031541 RepID=A0A239JIZ5_9RHOB|nr:glycosyltransferase family 2 protein [Tropicimonas sediminicola]SNT04714.1 Galactosyltransferase [Tropicimonas sediminicola]
MLLGFRATGDARWECILEFDRVDYANLSFFDANGQDIPFHVSFRQADGILAFNRLNGGVWGEEILTPCALAPRGDRVRIDFSQGSAALFLNDTEILRETIDEAVHLHWFDLHGAARAVRVGGAAETCATGELALSAPFTLTGWGVQAGVESQDLRIEAAGLDGGVPLRTLARPDIAAAAGASNDRLGVIAVLPGRVWYGVAAGESLSLQLTCNGSPCGAPLQMTREELVRTIEGIAADERAGAFSLVSAVEHAARGGIIPMLSEAARRRLSQAIDAYALGDLLNPEELVLEGDADFTPPIEVDPNVVAVEIVQKTFSGKLRAMAKQDPAAILQDPEFAEGFDGLTGEQQRLLVMRLAEVFAGSDQVEALVPLAERCALRAQADAIAPWEKSFRLPFDVLAEDADAVSEFFQWLSQRPEGWISTQALSWSIRKIATDCPAFLTDTARETAARAFVAYVEWHAWDYWGRGACTRLTEAIITLMEQSHLFSTWFEDWLVDRVLRSHWLSPQFWSAFDSREGLARLRHDGRIHAARAAYDAAVKAVREGSTGSGLTALPPASAIDGERLMRELAPSGWKGDRLASLAPHRLLDLALRRAALPGGNAAEAGPPEQIVRAIRSVSPMLPRSEYLELQEKVGREAAELLSDLGTPEAGHRLEALKPELRLLSGRRAGYNGVAIALSLLGAALRAGDNALACQAADLSRGLIDAVPPKQRGALQISPAVRMAVFGLRQTAIACDSALARELVALLPEAEAAVPGPADPATEACLSRDGRAMFFDTVVVVISCRPLLETRVKAQRETWLKDLAARGIPYVIVVGDGDDRLEGDVLHVDAPDSYEGLPRKVLAAVRWIYRNTPFSHMLKIDDDCSLDVDRFFLTQSYRKFAYYGRRLHRTAGQTDRTWHLTRAAVDPSQLDIDRSPEPSTYAEGGTGYVLNRTIMDVLLHNAETPEGARLILSSIMEDKLVGDLLGMTGILPDSEDYDACVLRRSHSKGVPVSRWENAFLPSAASPAKLVHLDTPDLQNWAAEVRGTGELWPKKAWPTYDPARIGWNTNAIDLVSPVPQLERVNAQSLVVITTIRNEREMLPLFLDHYRKLGVQGFFAIDNCSTDGTLEYLLEQPDVATFSADTDYSASAYGVAWQQAAMANFRLNRWSLIADADELLVLKDADGTLPDLLASPEMASADAARIFMLDLYPEGPLSRASFQGRDPFTVATHVDKVPFLAESTATGPFSNAETWTSSLRHRLLPGSRSELFVAQKYALLKYRPWMRLSAGLHYVAEAQVAPRDLIFAHFKYHAGFHAKVREETRRRQHFNDAEEYRRYRNLMAEGRENLFDPTVSVPWRSCDWVRERLD